MKQLNPEDFTDKSAENAATVHSTDIFNRRYWDIENRLSLTKDKSAKLMIALIKCEGRLTSSILFGNDTMPDKMRSYCVRINLPDSQKERFEELTGLELIKPEQVIGH
jgi:hypothetical protein